MELKNVINYIENTDIPYSTPTISCPGSFTILPDVQKIVVSLGVPIEFIYDDTGSSYGWYSIVKNYIGINTYYTFDKYLFNRLLLHELSHAIGISTGDLSILLDEVKLYHEEAIAELTSLAYLGEVHNVVFDYSYSYIKRHIDKLGPCLDRVRVVDEVMTRLSIMMD